MDYIYKSRFVSVESLFEVPCHNKEKTIRLSMLRQEKFVPVFEIRLHENGIPAHPGIILTEREIVGISEFILNYLHTDSEVPSVIKQLGYDPFADKG